MESAPAAGDQRPPDRVYQTDEIAVYWNARACIHSRRCVEGLPLVFQPTQRPWIHVGAAPADEIAAVVARCPSGALHFARLDGGAPEQPDAETTITPQPNGPLLARGRLRVVGPDGAVIREDTRMALCRCGHSQSKPFCDGSHRTFGFQSEEP